MKGRIIFSILTSIMCVSIYAEGGLDNSHSPGQPDNNLPNLIIIFTDDLGYGDLGCYGNTRIQTPNIDKLASEGCLFTDAYVPAAVCTPARYGLLTGRYPWRTFLKKNVIADSPSLIDPERYTLPKLFKDAGYATAAIGKWHLGFGHEMGVINYNQPVSPGPNEVGFDYFFGLPVGHFYPPYVYMRNHLVVGLDPNDPISIVKPPSGTPYQVGGKAATIVREDVSKVLFAEAKSFMIQNRSQPFFLYLATTKPHDPYDRHRDFVNSGDIGVYGDVIRELDFRVGEFLHTLDSLELTQKTIVIFSSDNGGIGTRYFTNNGFSYNPNTPLRGDKGDVWEGGVRIPFIIRYPGQVQAGSTSGSPFCMTDLMASFASMLKIELPDNAAEDSFDVLPLLLGAGKVSDHPFVLQGRGGILGLRWGEWIYIPDPGSGDSDVAQPPPDAPPVQLYRITQDISEEQNLYNKYPEKVHMMDGMLKKIVESSGREVW